MRSFLDLMDRRKYDPLKHSELDIAHAVRQLFEHTASDLAAAALDGYQDDDEEGNPIDGDDIKNVAFRDLLGDTLCDFGPPEQLRKEIKAWVAAGAHLPSYRDLEDLKTKPFTFVGYTR